MSDELNIDSKWQKERTCDLRDMHKRLSKVYRNRVAERDGKPLPHPETPVFSSELAYSMPAFRKKMDALSKYLSTRGGPKVFT